MQRTIEISAANSPTYWNVFVNGMKRLRSLVNGITVTGNYGDSAKTWQNKVHCHRDPEHALAAVVGSGHGTDADAGDYLNTDS